MGDCKKTLYTFGEMIDYLLRDGYYNVLDYRNGNKKAKGMLWNGKEMFIEVRIGNEEINHPHLVLTYPKGSKKHPDGKSYSWNPSPTDLIMFWQIAGIYDDFEDVTPQPAMGLNGVRYDY